MIFLIESNNSIIINNKIDEILKKNNLDKDNVIRYDLIDIPITDVINELNTYGLFSKRKVVIGENALFLTASKTKTVEHNLESLEKYINNPSIDNILILICDKLDNKRKIVKLLKEKGTLISTEVSMDNLIKNNLEDYSMDYKTINYFINYCSSDIEKILNELEKLKCFKLDDKKITIDDINKVVVKSLDDNVFDFINAVVSKNRLKAYEIYKELLYKGEEETKLIIMVADQIRLIYNCKCLVKDGMKQEEIATFLGVHPYKVKLAIASSFSYTKKELLSMLNRLYEIDKNIKTGKDTTKIGFQVFILSL